MSRRQRWQLDKVKRVRNAAIVLQRKQAAAARRYRPRDDYMRDNYDTSSADR